MQKITLSPFIKGLKVVALSVAVAFSMTACNKDKKGSEEDPKTTPAKFNALMEAGFKSLIDTQYFDASDAFYEYTTANGTIIKIDGTCLRKNGQPVTGQVTLEFYESFERKSMAIANKSTMGKNANNVLEPMKTGGQFYINVTQNGISLTSTCSPNIEYSALHTGGFDHEMTSWDGIFINNDLVWEPATSWLILSSEQSRNYVMNIPGFGWFNCDKLYTDPRPKTPLTIQVPTAYADASVVYAIIKGEPHSLGLATYGEWPVGIELYLIFVTEENGQYKWLTKEVTVTNAFSLAFDPNQATIGTKAQFEAHLGTLQ